MSDAETPVAAGKSKTKTAKVLAPTPAKVPAPAPAKVPAPLPKETAEEFAGPWTVVYQGGSSYSFAEYTFRKNTPVRMSDAATVEYLRNRPGFFIEQ